MPEVIEVDVVDAWLVTRLAALPELAGVGIYSDVAPPDAGYPFVVFNLSDNHDVMVVGGQRIMVRGTYVVRAVVEGTSYTPLVPIVAAVRGSLHRASAPAATPGAVLGVIHTGTVRYPTTEEGRPYRHLGGLFEVSAQVAAA